jgi:hypothetical protein
MKSNHISKVAALWGLFIILFYFKIGDGKDLKFIRDTIIETTPWTGPYYLSLKLGGYYCFSNNPIWPLPFPRDTINPSYRGLAPSVDYFWVLNSGGLVFFTGISKSYFF